MNKHSVLAGMIALVSAATLTLAGCGGGGGGGGAVSVGKFCSDAQVAAERFADVDEFNLDATAPSELREMSKAITKLADESPAEIRDDAQLIATEMAKALDGDYSTANDDAVSAASDRVDAYESDHCADGN